MRVDERRQFSVIDVDRELRFCGVCLGHSSSWADGKQRWAEISIFRTHAGTYVVSGVGRTVVAGEQDKCWAQVCETPECVMERLYLHDRLGGRYLPNVSRRAITEARVRDSDFNVAYRVEQID